VSAPALWRFETAGLARARSGLLFALVFATASVAVALVGLSAGGAVAVQGFARTSVSLLQLVLWLVPLFALIAGAVAGADCHDLEFIAALPVFRRHIVLARWAAWAVALGAALAAGLGAAGVAIGLLAGAADGVRYLALVGVSELLLCALLATGIAAGIAARTRARALGAAVALWLFFVVGVDLIAMGLLAVLPAAGGRWGLSLLLLADPVDCARALGLGLFQADVVAGPLGAALHQVLGGWGAALLAGGLVLWTVLPLALAARWFARRDL